MRKIAELTFADDTKLIRAIKELSDKNELQQDLLKVSDWATSNNMVLHESKFQLLSYRLNKSALLGNLPFMSEVCSIKITTDDRRDKTQ